MSQCYLFLGPNDVFKVKEMIERSSPSHQLVSEKLRGFSRFHKMVSSDYNCRRRSLLSFFDQNRNESCQLEETKCDVCLLIPSFCLLDVSHDTRNVLFFIQTHSVHEDVLVKMLYGVYQGYQNDLSKGLSGVLRHWSLSLIHDYVAFLLTKSLLERSYSIDDCGIPIEKIRISNEGLLYLKQRTVRIPLLMSIPLSASPLKLKWVVSPGVQSYWRRHCTRYKSFSD